MSFQDYVKKKDAEQQTQTKQEAEALKSLNEKAKNEAIITLGKKLTEGLPTLRAELGEINFGFVDNAGAYGDFTLEGKPFRIYTRQQGSPVSGQNVLVVCVMEAKIPREIGTVLFDRERVIFPKFEEALTQVLRKELKL